MADVYEQKIREKIRDAANELLAGEISEENFHRELDTCKALIELVRAANMGTWRPCPPEERVRREAMLIEKWPEACRKAGVGAIPMPDDMMRAITSFVGRAS